MKPTGSERDERSLVLRILYYGVPLALIAAVWVFEPWPAGMISLALVALWFYLGRERERR